MPDFSLLPSGRLDNVIETPPGGGLVTGVLESSISPNSIENLQSTAPFVWSEATFKLLVSQFEPSGEDTFTYGDSDITLKGLIPWEAVELFVRQALGYSYIQVGGGGAGPTYQLRRVVPLRHPRYTFAVCTGVSVLPFSPTGQNVSKFIPGQNSGVTNIPVYRQAQVTLTFSHIDYHIFTDAEMAASGLGEWERYTRLEIRPSSDTLSNGLDFLKFAAGPLPGNAGPLAFPSQGAPISYNAGPGLIIFRNTLILEWLQVPEGWLFDQGKPTQIQRCVGKVNRTTFMGYRPGELQMTGVEFQKQLLPLVAQTDASAYCYNVRFILGAFQPDVATTSTPPTSTTYPPVTSTTPVPFYGFQTAPEQVSREFWPVTSTGYIDGPRQYQSAEFRDMFKCCKDTPTPP